MQIFILVPKVNKTARYKKFNIGKTCTYNNSNKQVAHALISAANLPLFRRKPGVIRR
ncbi:hypothetical protein KUC_1854 [Vreelandella boliviensis LC1]|uniref:Uncharacterized protein n=1 Tax=Vreelandella boliviensis LC1 TaxID=1072583 RepID=A0A7U9C450_9GAMM|nr:hypothetical protein KUC_1854 [Halomonas boliviensis LC1]